MRCKKCDKSKKLCKCVKVEAESITTTNLTATNGVIANLDVISLNGKTLDCGASFVNENDKIIRVEYDDNNPEVPIQPANPNEQFNADIWNFLWEQAVEQGASLEQRLHCGRLQKKMIYDKYGCTECPPDGYEDCHPTCPADNNVADNNGVCACPDEVGVCPAIPTKIWGIQTVSPFQQFQCGTLETDVKNLLVSTMTYNLDVLNLTESLATRVVAVLVHGAYIDNQTNDIMYATFDFGTRQFGATLDTLYGEKYTGTVVIPSPFTQEATFQMPEYGNLAALQMVVYAEDGVDIDAFSNNRKQLLNVKKKLAFKSRNVTHAVDASGPVDIQSVESQTNGQNPGQIQNANKYLFFSGELINVTGVEYDLTIETSGSSMQWVLVFKFIGSNQGGYVGLNTDSNGKFQVLFSIWDTVDGAAELPYVSLVPFGGEGNGLSLRITQDNIPQNFPINVGEQYTFRLNRRSTDAASTTWECILTNVTQSITITLGYIKTKTANQFIDGKENLGNFVEAFGLTPPLTCDTLPQTVASFSFPRLSNDTTPSAPTTENEWTPGPDSCGAYRKEYVTPQGPIKLFYRS